jgi:hypothetical protein
MAGKKADGRALWSDYLEQLVRTKVPERARCWYVVRVEQYLKRTRVWSCPTTRRRW